MWNMSNEYEFGIHVFVRDDVIVEVCCKVGSEFVCPTDSFVSCSYSHSHYE